MPSQDSTDEGRLARLIAQCFGIDSNQSAEEIIATAEVKNWMEPYRRLSDDYIFTERHNLSLLERAQRIGEILSS